MLLPTTLSIAADKQILYSSDSHFLVVWVHTLKTFFLYTVLHGTTAKSAVDKQTRGHISFKYLEHS